MYKVIGITGPARVGKDTAADHIIKNIGYVYSKTSFADPIKTMLGEGLGLTPHQLFGDEKERIDSRYGCSARHMMQTLGTEWGRKLIDQNIWVHALKARIENIGGNWLVPDVRFESEADMIRENGILIHIFGKKKIGSDHISESGIYFKEGDICIQNDGTLDEYLKKIGFTITTHLI
jgi:hypothetical protein